MSKQLITFMSFMIFFITLTSYYYYWTVPANSIWYDQRAAIEVFQKIIDGHFPLVGYNHSIGIPSFAAFYYIFSPIYYFLNDPIQLYYFTAFINIFSILILTIFLYLRLNTFSAILFGIYSATNIWGLYYGSFLWNPNLIPFFMTLLYIFTFKYFDTNKIKFFHISGLLINLIVQMSPQSISLVLSFGLTILILKKLPKFIHLFTHSILHFILISPWLVYTTILDTSSRAHARSVMFKDFSAPLIEYTSYIGGWGLTQETGKFLNYGTIISPENQFFIPLLKFSTCICIILVLFFSFKFLTNNPNHRTSASWINLAYFACLINLLSISFFFFGLRVNTHHYQFLTPTIALILILGINFKVQKKIFHTALLLTVIFTQGTYSYWRAYSESIRPYINDIGYKGIFSEYVKNQCPSAANIEYATPTGIQRSIQYGNLEEIDPNCNWMIVQNNHYDQSTVIRDLLNDKFQLSQNKFKDYLIWIIK